MGIVANLLYIFVLTSLVGALSSFSFGWSEGATLSKCHFETVFEHYNVFFQAGCYVGKFLASSI